MIGGFVVAAARYFGELPNAAIAATCFVPLGAAIAACLVVYRISARAAEVERRRELARASAGGGEP